MWIAVKWDFTAAIGFVGPFNSKEEADNWIKRAYKEDWTSEELLGPIQEEE